MKPGTSFTSSSKKLPVAALAAAVIIACVEWGFVYPNRDCWRQSVASLLEEKRTAMISPGPAPDIAVFGSSRLYHLRREDIALSARRTVTVENFSWAWSGVETFEAALRTLIDAGKTPRVIVVDGMPELFGYPARQLSIRDNAEFRLRFIQTVPMREALRVTWGAKDWGALYEALEFRFLPPSMVYGDSIKSWLVSLKSGLAGPLPPLDYDTVMDGWRNTGAFQYGPPGHVVTEDECSGHEKAAGPFTLYDNRQELASYERFLELAAKHGVEIVVVPVPNNPLMFERFEITGVFSAYNDWLNRQESLFPNFHAPAPRWLNWPESMADPGHLNAEGTRRHREYLKEEIGALIKL